MIADNTIKNNKVAKKQKPMLKSDYCKTSCSKTSNLCFKQVVLTTIFKSNVTVKARVKLEKPFIKKFVIIVSPYVFIKKQFSMYLLNNEK